MSDRKKLVEALEELGIRTEEELNEAIQKLKPVDLSLMTVSKDEERKDS